MLGERWAARVSIPAPWDQKSESPQLQNQRVGHLHCVCCGWKLCRLSRCPICRREREHLGNAGAPRCRRDVRLGSLGCVLRGLTGGVRTAEADVRIQHVDGIASQAHACGRRWLGRRRRAGGGTSARGSEDVMLSVVVTGRSGIGTSAAAPWSRHLGCTPRGIGLRARQAPRRHSPSGTARRSRRQRAEAPLPVPCTNVSTVRQPRLATRR